MSEQAWQDIRTAPRTGRIICYHRYLVGSCIAIREADTLHTALIYPSHWMPLPLPPPSGEANSK